MNPRFVNSFLLITLMGAYSFQQKQACDINQEVYKNPSQSYMLVTMEFIDGCPDADSYVYVRDASGKEASQYTVPDMQTRIFHIDVPASGTISFNCRGNGHNGSGGCSSRLISANPE